LHIGVTSTGRRGEQVYLVEIQNPDSIIVPEA